MSVSKQLFNVGGLPVSVYSSPNATDPAVSVAVLFILHGRTGSAERIEWVAHSTLQWTQDQRNRDQHRAQDLFVVTLDHRNHGSRLVDVNANSGWKENVRHAIDMYSIQTGSSRDVSFLIDFLPAYLFPEGERVVSQWLMAGISLGGHSTWITLRNEPRVKLGIPIIGCPDYLTLMASRAQKDGVPFAPPYLPDSLRAIIAHDDPAAAPHTAADAANPFQDKKVLVLCGADDTLVPYAAGRAFVEALDVGSNGVKKVVVAPGVGHECTPDMVREMAAFVWEHALAA